MFSYVLSRHLIADSVRAQLTSQATLVAERLEQSLLAVHNDIGDIARSSLTANALVDSSGRTGYLQPFLQDHQLPVRVPFRLRLADYAGRFVAGNLNKPVDYGGRPWWQRVLADGQPHTEITVADTGSTLIAAFPVIYPSTQLPEGALVLELALQPLFEKAARGIEDRYGVTFGATAGRLARLGSVAGGPVENLTAEVRLGPVADLPLLDLSVTVELSKEQAYRELNRLGVGYLLAGVLILLSVAALARLASLRLVAPLRALTRSAEEVHGNGEATMRFAADGQDELAQLARSLQRMVDRLKAARETLEERVAERTAQLEFAESRLRAIHDNMLDGLITIDDHGLIESFSRGAEHIFGYSALEVIGRNVSGLMGEPHRSRHDDYIRRYLRTGLKRVIGIGREVEGLRHDDTAFPMELSVTELNFRGRRIFIGIVRDITERQRAQAALRRSEAENRKLAMVASRTDNAVVITDAQGRIEWVNDSFARITGYTLEEVLGRKPGEFLQGPETDPATVRLMAESLARGEGFKNIEILNYAKDGSPYWLNIEVQPIQDRAGRVVQFVAVESDITDRKRAEEQLRATLREKEILLREINHRVKNNLLVAASLLEFQKDHATDPLAIKMLDDSHNRIRSMALIHEKLSRAQALDHIRLDDYLEALVGHLAIAHHTAGQQIRVHTELAPLTIGVDTVTPCGLIVNELIANAFEHAFPEKRDGDIWISARRNDAGQIEIAVRDNGVGFPPDLEPGLGGSLGLQLVTLLTRQLEGELAVERASGTTFTLSFAELAYKKRV
ncbi:MAG: PAS domain S-box protein [Candidatus Competibacteraceae bacterium]